MGAGRLERIMQRDKLKRFPAPLPRLATWLHFVGMACLVSESEIWREDPQRRTAATMEAAVAALKEADVQRPVPAGGTVGLDMFIPPQQ